MPAPTGPTSVLPGNNAAIGGLIGSVTAPDYSSLLGGLFGHNPAIAAFANMTNQANEANAARGQNILKLLENQGTAEMQLNQTNYQNQVGQQNQGLVAKGLYNTTVANNLQQGAQNWLNTANEQVSENSAMNIANMANSFTQQAPPLSLLTQLLSNGGGARINQPTAASSGFQQPGSMLDSGGGALNVNNQAMSGYNAAVSPSMAAYNAAYGFNGQTPWSNDPYMTSVPMQAPAASGGGTGGGSLSINGQNVYNGGGGTDVNANPLTDPLSLLQWLNNGGLSL